MGKSTRYNQHQRRKVAINTGPIKPDTLSSSSRTDVPRGTSSNRNAKSPNPTKRSKTTPDTALSPKQQGKQQVFEEPTGIDLEKRIAALTYGTPLTTTLLDASNNASDKPLTPETISKEIDMQDADPIPDKEPEVTLTVIEKPKSLFAAVLMDTVKGKTRPAKIELLQKIFFSLPSFVSVKQRELKKIKYLAVEFLNQDDLQTALTLLIPTPTDEDSNKTATLQIWDTIKPPVSVDVITEQNTRTIQVIDIPLNVTGKMVTAAFKRYGTIERLSMRTRNLFQHAFIRYSSVDDIKDFMDTSWCAFIAKNCVRVLPLSLTAEQRLIRQQFCLKLAGIPRNCQAGHLVDFLKSINAKSCFIPRNFQTYRQQNFAFVNFINQEDLDLASNTSYSYQKSRLYWCDQKAKTCFSCGSPDHSVKVCQLRAASRDPKKIQLEKLYNKYRPAQHKKRRNNNSTATQGNNQSQQSKPKSYAEVVTSRSPNNNRRPWNRQNINRPLQPSLDTKYQELSDKITQAMNLIESTFEKWNTRLDALAEKRKSRRNSRASSPSSSSSTDPSSPPLVDPQLHTSTKRTHIDVDTSSAEEPDDEIATMRAEMQKESSMMTNMLTSIASMVGLGGPPDDVQDEFIDDDDMTEAGDDESPAEVYTL